MTMTRFRKDTGTIIKPGPMITAEPDMIVTDEQIEAVMVLEDGNPAFVADSIVSFVVHERLGIQLYKVLTGLSNNPVLKARFKEFLADSEQAVDVYEQLQEHLGIPLAYIPPTARMTEGMDQKIIESFLNSGSADPIALEMAAINAVLTASSLCVANVELLGVIADGMTDEKAVAAVRNAIAELEGPAVEHVEWAKNARRAMARILGRSKTAEKATNMAEEMYGAVKAALS
jgi:hypothetical protein